MSRPIDVRALLHKREGSSDKIWGYVVVAGYCHVFWGRRDAQGLLQSKSEDLGVAQEREWNKRAKGYRPCREADVTDFRRRLEHAIMLRCMLA